MNGKQEEEPSTGPVRDMHAFDALCQRLNAIKFNVGRTTEQHSSCYILHSI